LAKKQPGRAKDQRQGRKKIPLGSARIVKANRRRIRFKGHNSGV